MSTAALQALAGQSLPMALLSHPTTDLFDRSYPWSAIGRLFVGTDPNVNDSNYRGLWTAAGTGAMVGPQLGDGQPCCPPTGVRSSAGSPSRSAVFHGRSEQDLGWRLSALRGGLRDDALELTMTWLSRANALGLLVASFLVWASFAQAVDVWTVGVNNTRQGWNKFETVLTTANVPRLKKIREFMVDEKIDVSPLVVADKLYVFTMTNTAFVFDVNTGAQLARRQFAAPFDPADIANPPAKGMDLHNIYRNWGITATPVIDVATNTIYATTFGKPNVNSQNTERNNILWILDANTLADKKPPVLIEGNGDNGGGEIANGFKTPYQKMRAGLGLLTDADGNKAVVVSFSINGENPHGPGHGFIVAYDVRGLNRDAGFTPTPAIWNVTPGGGAGGVWMSGSAPAIDGEDIYFATGNGMDPGTMAGNFGESFVKLRYTAGVAGADNGKPTARAFRLLGRVQRL